MTQVKSLDVVYKSAVQMSIIHNQWRVYSSSELVQTTPKSQQNKFSIHLNNREFVYQISVLNA